MGIESKTLATIRSEVCNAVLIWLSGGALTILIVTVLQKPSFIPLPILAVAAILIAIINLFTLFRRKLPFLARASFIVALSVMAGVTKTVLYGAPYGFLDLALTVLMTAAFFGERPGIVAALTCVASLGTVYSGFALGLIPAPVTLPPPLAASTWILGGGMLVVTIFGPLIAISRLAQHVDLERQRAQDASDAKSKFLAMMSHELRTPLNAIMGFAEALGMDYVGPPGSLRYREYADDIRRSAGHLLSIVDDLLNLARIDVRQYTAATEPLDVVSELKSAIATIDGMAGKAGLDVRVQLDTPFPPMLADPKLFQQIMLNLLSNAITFTPAGGVITISASVLGDQVHIEVNDTGIGISKDEIPHLGQPFRQAKHPMVRANGGAGLGLALAKSFTELQQGELGIRSAVGVGTTVSISLPTATALASNSSLPPAVGANEIA